MRKKSSYIIVPINKMREIIKEMIKNKNSKYRKWFYETKSKFIKIWNISR